VTTTEITSKNVSDVIMASLRSLCEVISSNNDLTTKRRLLNWCRNQRLEHWPCLTILFFPFQILAAFLFVKVKKNSPDFTKSSDTQNCAWALHALFDRITGKPSWPENTAFWQPTKLGGKSHTDWTRLRYTT